MYAGGIVVLIIFSILLTHHISHKFERPPLANLYLGLIVVVVGGGLTIYTLLNISVYSQCIAGHRSEYGGNRHAADGNRRNGYALPFEVISILLLAAMIGAIVIAKKGK